MYKDFKKIFGTPSIKEVASRQLDQAQRDLLRCEGEIEEQEAWRDMCHRRIMRLTRFLSES